jgi:hypothetical protein
VLFEFVILGSQNIKIIASKFRQKRNEKRLVAKFHFALGFAQTNFQIRNQAVSFWPRGAWQILAKSGSGALCAPAERRSREAISSENEKFVKWRCAFEKIRTDFAKNL